jgi:hypothetical protein
VWQLLLESAIYRHVALVDLHYLVDVRLIQVLDVVVVRKYQSVAPTILLNQPFLLRLAPRLLLNAEYLDVALDGLKRRLLMFDGLPLVAELTLDFLIAHELLVLLLEFGIVCLFELLRSISVCYWVENLAGRVILEMCRHLLAYLELSEGLLLALDTLVCTGSGKL